MPSMSNMPSSSPRSSDGATHHETPSTYSTTFSPETIGTVNSSNGKQPKFYLSVSTDGTNTCEDAVAGQSVDDVFLNAATTTTGSQLSPVADTFTPGHYAIPPADPASAGTVGRWVPVDVDPNYRGGLHAADPGPIGSRATVASTLLEGSVPDDTAARHGQFVQQAQDLQAFRERAGLRQIPALAPLLEETQAMIDRLHGMSVGASGSPLLDDVKIIEGTFSVDEQRGRAVLISGVSTACSELTILSMFNQQLFNSITGTTLRDLKEHGVVIVGFSNMCDTAVVESYVRKVQPSWTVRRILPKQYARRTSNVPVDTVTDHEAELVVNVFYDGNQNHVVARPVVTALKQTLATFGNLKAFHTLPPVQRHTRGFRIEFQDTRSAQNALVALNDAVIEDVLFTIELYQPDVPIRVPEVGQPVAQASPPEVPQVLSATGRSTVPAPAGYDSFDRVFLYGRYHPGSSSPHRRYREDVNGNHNQVVISRIEFGIDVRTTIMLRNIPNKIDQAMLKEILDETSHGAYDFMYLRIDFANNCNVGYAFINFVDALAIIPFAIARAGQRWNKFSSDKVAEISYATIQGKDCLVQKFRNSSVMLEHPSFRPKLFTTGSAPDAGKEEPFPGPDNVSKMRRSVENAEHVGLFVPTVMDFTPIRTQRLALPPAPERRFPLAQFHPPGRGTYLPPARATLPTPAGPSTSTARFPAQSRTTPAPSQYTPSTSTDSLRSEPRESFPTPPSATPARSGLVDTTRADDAFGGLRTCRRSAPMSHIIEPGSLFAPRQGQAFREEQRRRRSPYDRGTPGAEFEAYSYRLTDPALSPVSPYTPRLPEYGSVGGLGPAYGPGTSNLRPGYGHY